MEKKNSPELSDSDPNNLPPEEVLEDYPEQLEDGIYVLKAGREWLLVKNNHYHIFRAPVYDMGYLMKTGVPFRGHIHGNKKTTEPTPLELTDHMPSEIREQYVFQLEALEQLEAKKDMLPSADYEKLKAELQEGLTILNLVLHTYGLGGCKDIREATALVLEGMANIEKKS